MARAPGLKSHRPVKLKTASLGKKRAFKRPPPQSVKALKAMGRPPLEPQNYVDAICSYVRKGNYVETAAVAAGISKDTLYTWLKEGAKAPVGSPFRDFSDALGQAVAESETRLVDRVENRAVEGDIRADLWRLERRFPDRWGQRGRLEVTGEGGGPVRVTQEFDFGRLSTTELETLERLLAKARPPQIEAGSGEQGGEPNA